LKDFFEEKCIGGEAMPFSFSLEEEHGKKASFAG